MNHTKEHQKRAYLEAQLSAYLSSQTGTAFRFEQVDRDVRENLQTGYEPVTYRLVEGYAFNPWMDDWTLPYGITGEVPDHMNTAEAIDADLWRPVWAEDGTPAGEPTDLGTALQRLQELQEEGSS